MSIVNLKKDKCCCLQEGKIEKQTINNYLTFFPERPIFIFSKKGNIEGIISLGNLQDYLKNGTIQRNFKYILYKKDYEKRVEEFFNTTNHTWIPVVNEKNELIECYIRQQDRFKDEYERTLYEKLKTCEIIAWVEKKGYNRVAVCVGDDLGENVYQHLKKKATTSLYIKKISWEELEHIADFDLMITMNKCKVYNEINIDMYSMREILLEIEFLKLITTCKKKGVSFFCFSVPTYNNIPLSEEESARVASGLKWSDYIIQKDKYYDLLRQVLGSNEAFWESRLSLPSVIYKNGLCYISDYASSYCNVVGGNRKTVGAKKEAKKRIYMAGNSFIFGPLVEDRHTLASLLQKESAISEKYQVINEGLRGVSPLESLKRLNSDQIETGDIVILGIILEQLSVIVSSKILRKWKEIVPIYALETVYQNRNKEENWFLESPTHPNEKGYLKEIPYICNMIIQDGYTWMKKVQISFENEYRFPMDNGLKEYLLKTKEKLPFCDGKRGAIVMNCNPLTYGHRKLIKIAASCVDQLIIFTVQENKSEFTFQERMSMLQSCAKEFSNVVVVESGNYIISKLTFPEYFTKEDLNKNTVVDTSEDVLIFGNIICRELGIKVRFVGEEPIDMITAQYNQTMKQILPQFGVEVVEIPRFSLDNGEIISATKVRKFIKSGAWNIVRNFVPEYSYKIICQKYNIEDVQ